MQSARFQRCLAVLGAVCETVRICPQAFHAVGGVDGGAKDGGAPEGMFEGADDSDDFNRIMLCKELHEIALADRAPKAFPVCCLIAARYGLFLSEAIQGQAVRSMCAVFTGNPRLLLTPAATEVLSGLLRQRRPASKENGKSDDLLYSDSVMLKLLQSLKDLLMAEEVRERGDLRRIG